MNFSSTLTQREAAIIILVDKINTEHNNLFDLIIKDKQQSSSTITWGWIDFFFFFLMKINYNIPYDFMNKDEELILRYLEINKDLHNYWLL
jgi:hypothetical protein